MKIVSVNVAQPEAVEHNGKIVSTGIFKKPVSNRLAMTFHGLEGDGQADLEAHGGADKAIYVYAKENYHFWETELGRSELPFGQFGENLTVAGLLDEEAYIGDRFEIGQAKVEITQPRIPCFKLGIRMGSATFPKLFLRSRRVGFYLRVLQKGDVGRGDSMDKIFEHPVRLSVAKSLLALKKGPEQSSIIRQALEIEALSDAWRQDLQTRIQKYG